MRPRASTSALGPTAAGEAAADTGHRKLEDSPDATAASARVLLRLLARARSHERGALDATDAEELHQLRVGLRRLRGAMRMLGPALGLAKLRLRRMMIPPREAMRRAGAVRDLDVFLEEIDAMASHALPAADPTVARLVELVHVRRDKALRPLRRYLASKTWSTGALRLELVLAARAATTGPEPSATFAKRRLKKELVRCHDAIAASDLGTLEGRHGIRIVAKRLRDCADAVTDVVPFAHVVARAAETVQKTLGHERDAALHMALVNELVGSGKLRPSPALVVIVAALTVRSVEARALANLALGHLVAVVTDQ